MDETHRSIGTAAPAFLILALLAWLYMLWSIWLWIGKAPIPGRETDRMMAQLQSGIAALVVWLCLAAVLLIVSSRGAVPVAVGAIAWLAHPLSFAGAAVAIAILYDPALRWPVAIPVITPLLISAYAAYALFPAMHRFPLGQTGYALWAVTTLLSLAIIPAAVRFAQVHLDDGSIEATPGPQLDAWMAKQRERERQSGLEELSHFDDETKLYEPAHLIHPDSPVLKEALDFMRHMPHRQQDAVMLLQSQQSDILNYLGDIELQPTPELCTAARAYLRRAVEERRKSQTSPNPFVGIEFETGLNSIRWIAKNCGCPRELDQMEAYARAQQQDAPEVKKFLEGLQAIRTDAGQ